MFFFFSFCFVYKRTKISWLSGIQKVPKMEFSNATVSIVVRFHDVIEEDLGSPRVFPET